MLKQIVFYAFLLLLWQAIAALHIWPEYLVPSPLGAGRALLSGFGDKSFAIGVCVSLKRLFFGYGLSIMFGAALGVLLFKYDALNELLGGLILGLQTMPSICWFPLALLWFGLSEWAVIFVVIAGSLFSITMSVNSSLRNMPPIILMAGRNLGARKLKMLFWVMLPSVTPSLLIGLRQSWSFAWRSLMAGELIFNGLGIGYLLNMGRELNDMNRVVSVMFLIAAISVVFDRILFGGAENFVRMRWGSVK